jgi:hypothetical protein
VLKPLARLLSVTLLALTAVAGLGVVTATTAAADCQPTVIIDPTGAEVEIPCSGGGGGGGDTGPGEGGGGGGDNGPRECTYNDWPIACETNLGTWNGYCHVRVADPQPGKDDPVWEGNDEGVILTCSSPGCISGGGYYVPGSCPDGDSFWSATAPPPGPSEAELAQTAVAGMNLRVGAIGSTPPSTDVKADSMGIVGVPTWLWIADPADNTTGPITNTASAGAVTVTATARLDRMEWTYTDARTGAVVHSLTCAGDSAPGTAWTGSGDGTRRSPTCGLSADQNGAVGRFTLTGTAYWIVDWAGPNESGTIVVDPMSASVPVVVGELQTIVTS